ncbi:serine hydrolase domain-containing protein [Flavobacterium sp. SM2513]|uniref:serine hydrolase domain-containing protein n=1 Tax=Flavobacterium sp. SM2513 TaxID=3424766 RepID=UPI003D7FD275
MKNSIIVIFLLILTTSIFAQNKGKFQKLDSLFSYLTENNRFMGAVQIREKENVVFDKAYGFVDYENKIEASPNTKYKIGSITKMFTAALVFQLIEEKKLTLEMKLSRFYPEIQNAEKITIGQMLNHKSGIFNFTDAPDFMLHIINPTTKEAMIEKISSFSPAFEPNAKAEYSNSNYLLIGYIIEKITKNTYAENVNKRIINKIGLKNTSYYSKINPADNEAYSFTISKDKKIEKVEEWDESQVGAAGALQSTSSDLTQFATALFDGKIINKNSLAEMTKLDDGYGKGIFTAPFGDRIFYMHNGGIEGFTSTLGYYPKEKLGFSIIMNLDNFSMNALVVSLLSIYYKMPYEFPEFNEVTVLNSILSSYQGVYASESIPLKITIKNDDGTLVGQATGQNSFPLDPVSTTEFVFEQAKVNIKFTGNGFILTQNGQEIKFRKE